MSLADDLDGIDAAEELTGYVPDPWRNYLNWVLVEYPNHDTARELRRLVREVLG